MCRTEEEDKGPARTEETGRDTLAKSGPRGYSKHPRMNYILSLDKLYILRFQEEYLCVRC